jgi:hypothetical protein
MGSLMVFNKKKFRRATPWLRRNNGKSTIPRRQIVGALERQSHLLEKHEKRSADHNAIQTYVAILSLIMSFFTTFALGYISYIQYKSSERQVILEYAKVEPHFLVTSVGKNQTTYYGNKLSYFPNKLKISIQSGDAQIESVDIKKDMYIRIIDKNNKHHICIIRVDNYFSDMQSEDPFSANQLITKIQSSFKPDLPNGDFVLISPSNTWINIKFLDLFGKERTTLLTDGDQILDEYEIVREDGPPVFLKDIDGKIPQKSNDSEMLNGRINVNGVYPHLFQNVDAPSSEGCKYVLSRLAT